MKWVIWFVGIAVGLSFVLLDPAQTIAKGAAWPHLQATLVTVAWFFAAMGAGALALERLTERTANNEMRWAHALATGILIWGVVSLVLGALVGIHLEMFAVLFVAMMGCWLLRPTIQMPRLSPFMLLLLGVALTPGLIGALAPSVGTDAIYTHLAIPQAMLMDGELLGGFLHPQGSRPLILHLPYASLLAFGGPTAPALFHWLLSGAVLVLVLQMGRVHLDSNTAGIVAALLLCGSWTFLAETTQLGNDIPTAFVVTCALDAALRGHGRALALAAGTALSFKYTAAGPIAGIFLIAKMSWPTRLRMAAVALGLVAPWWIRNLVEGLHPLFPFMGWPDVGVPMVFQHLDKYGAGRSFIDFLLLPWNAIMTAELDSFRFLGRLNPAFGVLLPFTLWMSRHRGTPRKLAIAAVVTLIAWSMGPHWLRYLIAGLPIIVLAAAAGTTQAYGSTAIVTSVLIAWLFGLPANLLPIVEDTTDKLAVVTGNESSADYMGRHITGHSAIEWANAHLPPDARVAMLFSWNRAHLQRSQVLGSVEDHVPTRHWLLLHGDESLHDLIELGVTHAIVRRVRFIKRAYPFLTQDGFEASLVAPNKGLHETLLMQASLLYQDKQLQVYALADSQG